MPTLASFQVLFLPANFSISGFNLTKIFCDNIDTFLISLTKILNEALSHWHYPVHTNRS